VVHRRTILTVTAVAQATSPLDAARAVAAEIATRADRHDREGTYSQENIDALWAAGIGNITLEAAHGGPGTDLRTVTRVVRAIGGGDASTALIWIWHLIYLRILASEQFGLAPAVRDRIFASSLAGPALINALRVERELGTPSRGGASATVARRTDDGWRITGRKIFSTGSYGLAWMVVWATTEGDPDGPRTGPFIVPADAAGITIEETWDHLGMRASASHDILFEDTPVPLDHAATLVPVGEGDPGLRTPQMMATMLLLLLAVYDGVAWAARDWLVGYLNERTPTNLGRPLATLPRFQAAVGEIDTLLQTNEWALDALAADLDAGGDQADRAGLAKVVVARNVIAVAEQAVSLVGNAGLTFHHPLQRHLRDALCSRIHSPQDDTILTNAGRGALERGG
jgi:alkylation response protein AidB-like acyl-CoA dehydrogenase